jgi:hypothetical protein
MDLVKTKQLIGRYCVSIPPLSTSTIYAQTSMEKQITYHDILALGFTEDDWWEDRIPWWATLETTGQCRYTKPIPAPSIELVGVRYNGTYQDGAINEVREAEDKPEIFYDEGEQAI